MRRILLSVGLLLLLCVSSLAGNLFPPVGVVAGASAQCPAGKKALRWTGDSLECIEPSDGLTIPSCPAGKMLSGITNGAADCVAPPPPQCRVCLDLTYNGLNVVGSECTPYGGGTSGFIDDGDYESMLVVYSGRVRLECL